MVSQNRTHAVMAQRHEPADSLDDYPTPPWATRALFEKVLTEEKISNKICWEPACGRSHMSRTLADYFLHTIESDIHRYNERQIQIVDFLGKTDIKADWIITNPPFNLGLQFVLKALERAEIGVAILARTVFVEGQKRYKEIYVPHPPTIIAHFVERVVMVKGRVVDPSAIDPKTGKTQSTATAYTWFVWIKGEAPRPTFWIPPCRKELERPGDYRSRRVLI